MADSSNSGEETHPASAGAHSDPPGQRESEDGEDRNGALGLAIQVLIVVSVLALLGLVYYIRALFVIVAFSVLLAYLLDRPIAWLESRILPQWESPTKRGMLSGIVLIIFLILLTLSISLVIPPIITEARDLIDQVPKFANRVSEQVTIWGEQFNQLNIEQDIGEYLRQQVATIDFPGLIQTLLAKGAGLLNAMFSVFAALVLIPILAYWFLKDHRKFRKNFMSMVPEHRREFVHKTLDSVNESMGLYVRGQLILMLSIFLVTFVALWALDIRYALTLALIAGITEAIPNVGPVLGLIPALIITLLTDPPMAIWVIVAYGVIQLLENQFLAPLVMGESMNLHPVTVILAILVGGVLGGVLGVLLALPLVAIVKILVDVTLVRREEYLGDVAEESGED